MLTLSRVRRDPRGNHMKFLLFLALLPSLVLGQVVSRPVSTTPGVPATGGTFTGPVIGSVFPPAQDFIFYADPAGSDANNCTSALTPCLTLQAALAKMPSQWAQKARIELAAGTYTISGAYNLRVGTPVGQGEPLVIQGAMEDSGLGERTITAGGIGLYGSGYVVSVTDDTLSPTLDQYEGYFLRMTTCAAGAACVGMTRIIRGNSTGGQFDFNVGGTSTTVKPAVGDKFVIERPSSIIAFSNTLMVTAQGGASGISTHTTASVIFNQLRFSASSTSGRMRIEGVKTQMKIIRHDAAANTGIELSNGAQLETAYAVGLTTPDIMGSQQTYGAGLYMSAATSGSITGILSSQWVFIYGQFVIRNGTIRTQAGGAVSLLYYSQKGGTPISIGTTSSVSMSSGSYGPLGQIVGATGGAIQMARAFASNIADLVISSNTGPGLFLDSRSVAYIGTLTGSGNTGAGISVQGDSYLYSAAGNTIAGTTSEVLVGAQATTHAAIAAGTPLIVPPHGTATKYGGTTNYPLSGTNTGDVTLGAVGSTPNANGATLTGQVWNAQPADATYPGVVTASAQTFAGAKTFAAPITLTPSALGTCGSAPNVEGTVVTVAGATTVPTKMCFCTYTPTGTIYAWQNITGTFATSAPSFGNTTTCPDSAL